MNSRTILIFIAITLITACYGIGIDDLKNLKDELTDLKDKITGLKTKFEGLKTLGRNFMAGNKTIKAKSFVMDTLGKSGRFMIRKAKDDMPVVVVKPYKLVQLTKNGTEIDFHNVKDFDKENFLVTEPVDEKRYGLDATSVLMNLTLPSGQVYLEIIAFKQAGTIQVESGEEYDVLVGAVKFNINLMNWTFCSSRNECKDKATNNLLEGDALELMMEIKGKNNATEKLPQKAKKLRGKIGKSLASSAPDTYDIDGSEMVVSNLASVDGYWTNITSPKIVKDGKKTIFKFRFPKFNGSLYYDPIAQDEDLNDGTTSSGIPSVQNLFVSTITIVVAVFKIMFQA